MEKDGPRVKAYGKERKTTLGTDVDAHEGEVAVGSVFVSPCQKVFSEPSAKHCSRTMHGLQASANDQCHNVGWLSRAKGP